MQKSVECGGQICHELHQRLWQQIFVETVFLPVLLLFMTKKRVQWCQGREQTKKQLDGNLCLQKGIVKYLSTVSKWKRTLESTYLTNKHTFLNWICSHTLHSFPCLPLSNPCKKPTLFYLPLPTNKGKELVFRFIIEYISSSLRGFWPLGNE